MVNLIFFVLTDSPILKDDWKDKRDHLVMFLKQVNRKYHRCYAIKYFLCEIFTLITVIFNMFLMKMIINNFWVEYQPAMSAFFKGNLTEFRQQSTVLFPFQAKCNISTFGSSGSIINHDAICYLPQNIVNEKIFAFLYIWYILIVILAVVNIIGFFTMLSFKYLRILDVGRMCERTISKRECKKISANGDYGYWFVLKLFHMNLSPVLFQDLANHLIELTDKQAKFKPRTRKYKNDDEEEEVEYGDDDI